MKLDMRPMLRGEVSSMTVGFSLEGCEPDGAEVSGAVDVAGEIVDMAGYMRLTLKIGFGYRGECARCLSAVEGRFETDFVRTVVNEGTLNDEQLENNVDEYAVIVNGYLDIDEEIKDEILFGFPRRLLCSEDCPGLCPVCGKPKRDGNCGCLKEERDPRWSVLQNYFTEEK